MKVSIAAFESTESGSICFFTFVPKDREWTRLTEFTDVELTDVPNAKILKLEDEIKALEKKRDELLEEWKPLDFPVPDGNMSTDYVEINHES